ncbi:MAG: NACHT domain-containing protein [Richelia sp. RM1_1_1]|nr:NACHT domain-containing protein [Richelia sp. RM1_1_1]
MLNNLDLLFSILTSIASPIKDKLQRNETVIKILKQYNLTPEHPPEDFSGVYAYTLVEYGVGKPRCLLEFFRQEDIKKAFRKAFDHYNPSILLGEVEAFVNAYALGDEIKALQLDIMREVAAFATIFIEVAKRTRTPESVLTSNQITSLHQSVVVIQEQLDRLPTLEGIRTEMARLAAEEDKGSGGGGEGGNFLAQSSISSTSIALAQEMRGWFETLGYRFEKYEVWQDNYFEWILNIPIRRNRYDRVLVRGMTGEVGLKDVQALDSKVAEKKTDEGWLVTDRRISKIARDEIEKQENDHLECFTFDELVATDADFSSYLDWLEAEVKRKGIDKNYVPLACIKEELDPVSKRPIGVSRYTEQDGWIEGYIDRWLDDPAKEHISILGEFGTGKTWFALHYAWVALQRYKDAQRRGVQLPRLPLVIPLRDYAKAVSVESLFSEFFFRQYEIPIPGYSAFEQLNRMGKLLLIFDGFDEMAARINRQEMINNFWELAKVVVPGAKVILTCRTEHFPEAREGRALLNAELKASIANLTGETPQFEVLELEKFDDNQIRQVLSLQTEAATVEIIMGNSQLLDLARRPVLTELILEALPDIAAGKPVDMSRVYLYAVQRKMQRDIKAERTFTSLADKMYFLCELAWEMLSKEQMSLNYRLFPDRIRRLFGSVVQEEKDLDHWHYDMMGQTMLIRNADGDYTPAHRSLLEFFVAYKFAAELGVLADDFSELVKAQSCLDGNAPPVEYTWSGYFERQLDNTGRSVEIPPLREFISEPLEKLKETLGRSPFTKAVMDLMLGMLNKGSGVENLARVIEATKGKSETEVSYVGGNAVTLTVKLDKTSLEGKDLSGAVVKGADFSDASLRCVNFQKTNVVDSTFTKPFSLILSLAFSPDDRFLVTGGADGEIRLWQVVDGKQILSFRGHNDWVSSVAFSPDGKIIASCSHSSAVKLWDSKTGECLRILRGHTNKARQISFSSNGHILASCSDDNTIKLWDISSGECVKTLQGHTESVWALAIAPNSQILASGSFDYSVKLWDISSGTCLKTLQQHKDGVISLAFSHDSKILATSGSENDQTIKLWDINTEKCIKNLLGHSNSIRSLSFSKDNKTIFSGSTDHTIKIWSINDGKCLKTIKEHNDKVWAIALNSNDTVLASCSYDQTINLWDINSEKCSQTLQGCSHWVQSITVSSDGKTIISGNDDNTIKLWDINTGDCFKTLRGHDRWITSITISPNCKIIASGSGDHTVKIWDVNTGKCLKTLNEHYSATSNVIFSPDGLTLASASLDKNIKLWEVYSGKCLQIFQGHTSWVNSIAFSSDGKIIVSGSRDRTIKLWDIDTGDCLRTLEGHDADIWSVAIAPDGKSVASGSRDGSVKRWNIQSEKCLKTLQDSHCGVESVKFSYDGLLLAASSVDQTITIWDFRSGELIKTLKGHTNRVVSVAFTPDDKFLVSGSYDETIKIWNIHTGECIKTFSNKPYANMNITDATGLTSEQKTSLKALGAVENK